MNIIHVVSSIIITATCRSKSLQNQIKSLRKKEQSETKALEDMILKVEENLNASNVRLMM